ncbi:hypothetical protein [Hyunsoonleella flava]|uniref:YtxH domain-containing protein n=1 Tax=Oceanospirillum sediminis TaxID=2760088 RepID=A0A839IZ40_9GAMM|nr:hypothetical protein [Hyunsoonleella flava]MBB1489874.1 hypothetical protein [Oceanospirillum sediminis]
MKKIILALALLFTVSTVFTSCREKKTEDKIEEAVKEVKDETKDAVEEVKDEVDDATH